MGSCVLVLTWAPVDSSGYAAAIHRSDCRMRSAVTKMGLFLFACVFQFLFPQSP